MKGVKGHIMTTCLSSCCHALHVSPVAVTHCMSLKLLSHIACLSSCCHTLPVSPAAVTHRMCHQLLSHIASRTSCYYTLHVSPAAVTDRMSHQLLLHIACLTSCCHTSHFSPAAPWALLCLQTQATARPAAEREPSSWQGRTHQNTGQSRSGHDTQCITAWKELRNMMHNRILQGQGPTTIVFRRRGVTCQAG